MTDDEAMDALVAAAPPWTDEEIRYLNAIFWPVRQKRLAREAAAKNEPSR